MNVMISGLRDGIFGGRQGNKSGATVPGRPAEIKRGLEKAVPGAKEREKELRPIERGAATLTRCASHLDHSGEDRFRVGRA